MPFGLRCRVLAAIDSLMTVSHRNPLHDPDAVLQRLHGLRPISAKQKQTILERRCERLTHYSLITAGICFGLSVLMVMWHSYHALPPFGIATVLGLVLFAFVAVMLSMVLSSLSEVWLMLHFQRQSLSYVLLERSHDQKQTQQLRSYSSHALEQAKQALQLSQRRTKTRLALLLGGSLPASLLKGVLEKLVDRTPILGQWLEQPLPWSGGLWNGYALLQLLLALLIGLLLGGALLQLAQLRRGYHIELLEQAIADKTRRRDARRRRFGPRA